MDYKFVVDTPANTSKEDAVDTKLKLAEGTIVKVWLFHPEGCHGLAYAAIVEGIHQLYPSNPEEAYNGNDAPMEWEDNYTLKAPAILHILTWNLDDTYDHKVYVRITVLRKKVDPMLKAMVDLLTIIKTLLRGRRVS